MLSERLAFLARAIVFGTILLGAVAFVAGADKQPPSRPIDLNAANVKELEELPGIGAVTAQAIVNFRQKSGPFHRVEDLLAIRGISARKLDRMRPYLRIGSAPAAAKPAPKPVPKPAAPPANKPASSAPKSGTAPPKPSPAPSSSSTKTTQTQSKPAAAATKSTTPPPATKPAAPPPAASTQSSQ